MDWESRILLIRDARYSTNPGAKGSSHRDMLGFDQERSVAEGPNLHQLQFFQ